MEQATWEQGQYWQALGGSSQYWSNAVRDGMTRQQAKCILEGFRDKQYMNGEISKAIGEREVPA